MMGIQTFVFLDLETTGLIQETIIPKITEIALIAVTKESICNSNKNSLPRILHKLVLPVNPQRVIPAEVEYLTKLSNEAMQLLPPFECGIYELIKHFLQRLTPPICFAAHNGNRFDYPIFLWEIECINKIVDSEILCIDTLDMFRDFFKEKNDSNQHSNNKISCPSNLRETQDLLNDEYNELLCEALDLVMMEERIKENTTNTCISSIFACEANNLSEQESRRKANEKTPKNQIIKLQNIGVAAPSKKRVGSRRKLDFEKPVNFKLAAIYEYMFSSSFTHEHSAESDCLAMIRCVSQIANFFVEWSDNNARPLILYKKENKVI